MVFFVLTAVKSHVFWVLCLKFLKEKNKIEFILSPYETKRCSVLLKRTGVKIAYISEQGNILKK